MAAIHGAVRRRFAATSDRPRGNLFLGSQLLPRGQTGDPTGEVLFNIEPRSCLVVGSLDQFQTDHGPNIPKFRSFELYRRHTGRPEIITFDELLERARFIVEHGPD